jgi:ABC-type phosphate/phosphonate transport system substrate-binding protein
MPRAASLPMYVFPALQPAHAALWTAIRQRMPTLPPHLDLALQPVPEAIGPEVIFTQICGFPLFRRFRGQAVMLATPSYDLPGCVGATHRAAFVVRKDDTASGLTALRGRVFGCNSLDSNTGMNLPRLSLARIAEGRPFFSRVVWTGGHLASLRLLAAGEIDLCSIDCVTWGLAEHHMPALTAGLRVLAWTEPSPCLPFATSVATAPGEAAALRSALRSVFDDPALQPVRAALHLRELTWPSADAYQILERYEQEAAALGYPDLV